MCPVEDKSTFVIYTRGNVSFGMLLNNFGVEK